MCVPVVVVDVFVVDEHEALGRELENVVEADVIVTEDHVHVHIHGSQSAPREVRTSKMNIKITKNT